MRAKGVVLPYYFWLYVTGKHNKSKKTEIYGTKRKKKIGSES